MVYYKQHPPGTIVPNSTSGYVYYIRLSTPQGVFYKIGYTTKTSIKDRFSYAGSEDYKLIDKELFFSFHNDAWHMEQYLLRHFERSRIYNNNQNPGKPLYKRGQTELFMRDVLGLDDDYYVPKERELPYLEEREVKEHIPGDIGLGSTLILVGIVLAFFSGGISLLVSLFGLAACSSQTRTRKIKEWKQRKDIYTPSRPIHEVKIEILVRFLSKNNEAI